MSFGYYTPFTVASLQITGTLNNFTAVITGSDNRFKVAGSGGHVQNSNGYDIRPFSDTGLTSALNYQLVWYDGASGTFEMWVLSSAIGVGAVVYLGYGNASLTTDGSSTSTWRSEFKGVYLFGTPSSLSYNDYTSNANNGSAAGSGNSLGSGPQGGAALVLNGSGYADMGDPASLDMPTNVSMIQWIKPGSSVNAFSMNKKNAGAGYEILIGAGSSAGKGRARATASSVDSDSGDISGLNDGSWHMLHGIVNAAITSISIYGDGGATSHSDHFTAGDMSNSDSFQLGARAGGNKLTGTLAWCRVYADILTTSWVEAEYNNQKPSSTFWTVGTEVPVSTVGKGLFYYYSQRSF